MMGECERWTFLAETKEAAIELLEKQERVRPGLLSPADYDNLIKSIEGLDLSMPPPVDQNEVIADGWRWIIKVSFAYERLEGHGGYRTLHEMSVTKDVLIYGLFRKQGSA